MQLSTPRDRSGSFEPEIVKKRQTILADSLETKIIGLYVLGMSLRDIAAHIKEIYDTDISHLVLSEVTNPCNTSYSLMAVASIGRCVHHCMARCDVLQGYRPERPCSNKMLIQCRRH